MSTGEWTRLQAKVLMTGPPKDAEDHQHLCSAIDKGYIGGKYGDEVYDAVKGKI